MNDYFWLHNVIQSFYYMEFCQQMFVCNDILIIFATYSKQYDTASELMIAFCQYKIHGNLYK